GSRSERGTEVAALFYSMIESAKLAGVEPDAFSEPRLGTASAASGSLCLTRSPRADRGAESPRGHKTWQGEDLHPERVA
ncbi:MAG: hypothetical protein RL033_1517, partial [Pseudomonadota bacterium]